LIQNKTTWGFLAAVALSAVMIACGGGGSGSGTTPSPTPTPTPSPTPAPTNTITIANNAVSPANITIARGSQVTFANNDNRTHDMQSDPHPEHTDCPELMQVGFLNPGQSRTSGNLNTARTCGYHDHNQDTVASLKGTITIQ
jgi:plastocyanin